GFLRAVCEGDAARFPLRIGRVDILDLEPQGAAVGPRTVGFLQEDGEAVAVAQRHGAPVGHVEFDRKAQCADVPVARAFEIADREIEVVELHHPRLLLAAQKRRMKPPPRTRLPLAPSYITQAWPGETPTSGSAKRTTKESPERSTSAGRSAWPERTLTCTGSAPVNESPIQFTAERGAPPVPTAAP